MRTVIAWGILTVLGGLGVNAVDAEPETGSTVFSVDLDKNGSTEKIRTQKIATKEDGDFFQLVVEDSSGKSLWEGPKVCDSANRLVFGAWHFGVSLPEVVADIDADGHIELVAPTPQSDVSPTSFRVLRWTGAAFQTVRTSTLLEEGENSGFYPWATTDKTHGRWISKFVKVKDGEVTCEIMDYAGGEGKMGTAVLTVNPRGYRVKNWISPLKPMGDQNQIESPRDAIPSPITAKPPVTSEEEALAKYLCQIGPEDVRNSTGKRLTTVPEILRQDRANYHKFRVRHRRDLDDETFFKTTANRELFNRVPVQCPPALAGSILNGEATVVVKVYRDRIVVSLMGEKGEY